jgi:hypothetical protein
MTSNSYNPSHYLYQQSSVQQYSTYQTAPAANNIPQPSRQYQPGTTQPTDYVSYQAHSYGGQNNTFGGAQVNSWGGANGYSGNRETTSRAAEVLRSMSNSTTAVSHPGFTATNSITASPYPVNAPWTQAQQASHTQTAHSSYAQSQSRPRSVNANRAQTSVSPAMAAGYPSQRATNGYNQQPQRTTSPVQPGYTQNTQPPAGSARSGAPTTTQYSDGNYRQLPNFSAAVSATSNYGNNLATAPAVQSTANNVPETYTQGAITVDPMAIYDPWPEYQRKQEAIRAQKAIDDTARVEDERIVNEVRQAEERKEEERTRQEAEKTHLAEMNQAKQKGRKSQPSPSTDAGPASTAQDPPLSTAMEEEIRTLMAKMREFNSKDPALLARIWEEERRAKAPKSPTIQSNPAPSAASITTAQASATPTANSKTKTASKKTSVPKPTTPATAGRTPIPPVASVNRSSGNTIWPLEKKSHLATAASAYLNAQNPSRTMEASEVLRMLDGNPSYIELCEQLETMGLKLDRAAFAKNLLTAVPDVNSVSRVRSNQTPTAGAVNGMIAERTRVAPLAVMKRDIGTPATPAASSGSSAPTPSGVTSPAYAVFPSNDVPPPAAVAEMIPIKRGSNLPTNKEEAARKRNFDDLIDLTQLPEDDDLDPPAKRVNTGPMYSFASPAPTVRDTMDIDNDSSANFPIAARNIPQPIQESRPPPIHDLRYKHIVDPLDRKKALRRNNYNIKTIARDVLLACGRHPETRQLNQHLELLRTTLPHQVTHDSDLSTLRWDLIDPGRPPPGYFKDSVQGLAEDADDEDSEDEESRHPPHQSSTQGSRKGTAQEKVQALPEAINPFKQKRRGRPPRQSLPTNSTTTPHRPSPADMSASAPRLTAATAGVGYAAFRSATEYDAEGKPLPKKKGRPVGWRKNIHGSSAAQARPSTNGHTGPLPFHPGQPSTLRHVKTREDEPIRIDSRSPSGLNKASRYQSYKCNWQNCNAELHNLETLKKHVHKVHGKENRSGALECFWADCPTKAASHDPITNVKILRQEPKSFYSTVDWQDHLEETHFSPLSWKLGDGPASGLSGRSRYLSKRIQTDINRLSRCERLRGLLE